MFSRNKRRREIERARAVLEDAGGFGCADSTHQLDRGRPTEIWIAIVPRAA
jgi:hypothetical protein